MDFVEVFDTFDHFLLIAKLEAYSFKNLSLEFMKNHLTNRDQRYKIVNCFSIWRTITLGAAGFNTSITAF